MLSARKGTLKKEESEEISLHQARDRMKGQGSTNIYSHRRARKERIGYRVEPNVQKKLAAAATRETVSDPVYIDMEFQLTQDEDMIKRRIEQLQLRIQRIHEYSKIFSSPAQGHLRLGILSVTLPFIIYFLVFMAVYDSERLP